MYDPLLEGVVTMIHEPRTNSRAPRAMRGALPRNTRPTMGVEYAVLSGVIACSLVLIASVFGPEIATAFNELTCDSCVVSLERRPPDASTAAASPEQTRKTDERRDAARR
jgi:Flp pilus assembly pilin Flp